MYNLHGYWSTYINHLFLRFTWRHISLLLQWVGQRFKDELNVWYISDFVIIFLFCFQNFCRYSVTYNLDPARLWVLTTYHFLHWPWDCRNIWTNTMAWNNWRFNQFSGLLGPANFKHIVRSNSTVRENWRFCSFSELSLTFLKFLVTLWACMH